MFFLSSLLMSPKAIGEESKSASQNDNDFPKSKWAEVNSLIDDIKSQNSPQNLRVSAKLGLIQIQTNTPDSVQLGNGNSVFGIGIDAAATIWNDFGLELSVIHGHNLVPLAGSPNSGSAAITWIDFGPRYTLNLDSARLDNYIAFKILYHQNDANFSLVTADPVVDPFPIFMTHYMGVAGSVERSIPISRKLGILASFDLLQIIQAQTPSHLVFKQNGYGFGIQGEIYYQLRLFETPVRLGLSYWQQGNGNEFDDSVKPVVHKNSYFQLSRSLFATLSMLF